MPEEFQLVINLDSAEFASGNRDRELALILRMVAARLDNGIAEGQTRPIKDTNGKIIGNYGIRIDGPTP